MSSVTVVDYGVGNLYNLVAALNAVGATVKVEVDLAAVRSAERLILPGVGAFGPGIEKLRATGLCESIYAFCRSGRPLLGICLGMQLLVSESEENGTHSGLDLIPGRVLKFSPAFGQSGYKVPQISWNTVEPNARSATSWDETVLRGLKSGTQMYFVHSYFVETKYCTDTIGLTEYGGNRYSSVIARDNIIGVQFHPERSADAGLRLLRNFLKT